MSVVDKLENIKRANKTRNSIKKKRIISVFRTSRNDVAENENTNARLTFMKGDSSHSTRERENEANQVFINYVDRKSDNVAIWDRRDLCFSFSLPQWDRVYLAVLKMSLCTRQVTKALIPWTRRRRGHSRESCTHSRGNEQEAKSLDVKILSRIKVARNETLFFIDCLELFEW